jgi:hypothetical protein
MRIFNLDAHISVISDIKKNLESIGHSVTSVNLTGHNFVMNLPRVERFGRFKLDFIWDYTPGMMKEEHGERLKDYDAFLVAYPPLLIRKFEKLGKPMIVDLCVRYDHYTCNNQARWTDWHNWFCEAVKSKRLFPVANSLYDMEYTRYFTGLTVPLIPSICDYHGLDYVGDIDTALLWDSRADKVKALFSSEVPEARDLRALYPRYDWKQIVRHKAIVHIPYNASQMSLFEHYSMNVPILAPTPEFLINLRTAYGALNEITDRLTSSGYPPGSWGKGTFDAPDPNEYNDPQALLWWTQYYDVYNLPHVIRFDSLKELRHKLATTDFKAVSEKMKATNVHRKADILFRWKSFLEGVK